MIIQTNRAKNETRPNVWKSFRHFLFRIFFLNLYAPFSLLDTAATAAAAVSDSVFARYYRRYFNLMYFILRFHAHSFSNSHLLLARNHRTNSIAYHTHMQTTERASHTLYRDFQHFATISLRHFLVKCRCWSHWLTERKIYICVWVRFFFILSFFLFSCNHKCATYRKRAEHLYAENNFPQLNW